MTDLLPAAAERGTGSTRRTPVARARRRVIRLASAPAAASTARGQQVIRLDGRTRIVGIKRGVEWVTVGRGVRLDRAAVERLDGDGVNALLCRRGLRYARVTLSWLRR